MKNFLYYIVTLIGIFIVTYVAMIIIGSLVAWETPMFLMTDYDCIGYKILSTFVSGITAIWHGGNIIDKAMTKQKYLELQELDKL